MSTAASKRKQFVLDLGIMYVYFRQITSVSVSSRRCGFIVLNKLAVVFIIFIAELTGGTTTVIAVFKVEAEP